jgi:hypothetical protein
LPFKHVEVEMADNKSKRGPADRRRVAGGEGYEVQYFARKHQISAEQVRKLIERVGNDRDKLNKAAAKLAKK